MKTFGIEYVLEDGRAFILQIKAMNFDDAEQHLGAIKSNAYLLGRLVTSFDVDLDE